MIAMHMTFSRQLHPALGMFAIMGAALTLGALAEIYLADYLIYPLQWADTLIYQIEVMITSLLFLLGLLPANETFPAPGTLSRDVNIGVFAGALYIALEVFYVIAVLVVATRQAVNSQSGARRPEYRAPKKLLSAYLTLNLLYTLSFLYLGMFIIGFASSYDMAFSFILRADGVGQVVLASLPWKLALFVPVQVLLLVALWKELSWFKTAFVAYLLVDVAYFTTLTFVPERAHSLSAGFIVSTLALLFFLPYLRKSTARKGVGATARATGDLAE